MSPAVDASEPAIETELVQIIRHIDMYLQQKTDLFLQHYLLDPADQLFRRMILLSVIITILVCGIIILIAGVILLIATVLPLWASLLLFGVFLCGTGCIAGYLLLSNQIILDTPVYGEHEEKNN